MPVSPSLLDTGRRKIALNNTTPLPIERQAICLRLITLISVNVILLVSAWAQQTHTVHPTKSREVSGFLGDYSGLYPAAENGDLLVYVKEKGILNKYDKFIVDPVAVQLLPEAQDRNLDPGDLSVLAYDCRQALVDELQKSGRYKVVKDPGPGVLHLRAALTDVQPARAKTNAAVKGGALAASAALAPGASLAMPRLSVGRASIEAEMSDSQSGERMIAVVTSKQGRRFFSGLRGVKKWGDVEAAFKYWARAFRERLDQVHGFGGTT
jgi:hypothetical protein